MTHPLANRMPSMKFLLCSLYFVVRTIYTPAMNNVKKKSRGIVAETEIEHI